MKARAKPPRAMDASLTLSIEAVPRVRAPTLAAIVQQKIINDISRGVLPPGMRLEEIEIAARYDVSRTPVREALRQLAALGMVDIKLRQGVVVAERSLDHFTNLLEVIADLEASGARYAALRMTEAERMRLCAVQADMAQIVARSQTVRFDRTNRLLHQIVHEGAHNDALSRSIEQMRMRTLPYTRAEFISERKRMEISHMEHHGVVQAIMRREAEGAYHAMRLHVIDAGHVTEDLVNSEAG
jgi:DNA-binding GntR family transcriptional regulator